MKSPALRQALLFVALSGTGWLLDTTVFMLLSGPGGWPVVAANMVSGSCGSLFVFMASSRGVFRRNEGSMLQKVGALLLFNAAVIVASSVVLGLIAAGLADGAARLGWAVAPGVVRLLAKVLVTPVTLALNFVIVRFLLERFIGVRRPDAVKAGAAKPEAAMQESVR